MENRQKITAKYDPGMEVEDEDLLCLHRNENLFVSPQWTIETAQRLIPEVRIANYPEANSLKLRQAIGALYNLGPENVYVGNGSDEILSDLLSLLRYRYSRLSLLDVCFKVYHLLAQRFGFDVDTFPSDTFRTGELNIENWAGLALIDSPNAISGACVSKEKLEAMSSDPDSFVIWDNVYGEFAGDLPPVELAKNFVFIRSFSKFYGLASLRVGYCLAHEDIITELLAQKDVFNVNGFAQTMAAEALARQGEFEEIGREIRLCRSKLVARLQGFGFETSRTGGNFVLASHPEYSGEHIQSELMKRKIAVRHFPDKLTANHVRITVPPEAGIEQLATALEEVLNG